MSFQVARPYTYDYNLPTPPPVQQRPPSILDQFGAGLGQGLGEGFNQGIKRQLQQSVVDKALKNFGQNVPLQQQYESFAALPEDVQRQIAPLLEHRANQQQAQQKAQTEQQKQAFEFEKQRRALESKEQIEKEKIEAKAKYGKHSGVLSLDPEERNDYQQILNDIGDLYSNDRIGLQKTFTSAYSADYQEASGKLEGLRLPLVSLARKLENQGHLTQKDMDRVFKTMPNATDTHATAKGKLIALAKILKLDPSQIPFLQEGSKSQKAKNKTESSYQPGQKLEAEKNGLPSTAGVPKNARMRDDKTGKVYIFNGSRWQEEK